MNFDDPIPSLVGVEYVSTRFQLLLAMARNLFISTRRKKDSEDEKSAEKG